MSDDQLSPRSDTAGAFVAGLGMCVLLGVAFGAGIQFEKVGERDREREGVEIDKKVRTMPSAYPPGSCQEQILKCKELDGDPRIDLIDHDPPELVCTKFSELPLK